MPPTHHRLEQPSTTAPGGPTLYIEVEASLRHAGRLLEYVGVTDAESDRLSGIVFRLAQRVRTDRLEGAA